MCFVHVVKLDDGNEYREKTLINREQRKTPGAKWGLLVRRECVLGLPRDRDEKKQSKKGDL